MNRQAPLLIGIGGLVVVGMAAAVFLVLSGGPSAEPSIRQGPDKSATAETPEPEDEAMPESTRRRARRSGNSAIVGEVVRGDDRAPVANQRIALTCETAAPMEAVTDSSGVFRFEELAGGVPYDVRLEAPGFASVRIPGVLLEPRETRDVGTLVLDQAVAVPVEVRTYSGAPIEGATVLAFVRPEARELRESKQRTTSLGDTAVAVASTRTGADGNARFPGLAVGSWTFVATREGFARTSGPDVRLTTRTAPPTVRIHMAPGHVLTGHVVDSDGPVHGALVIASPDERGRGPGGAPHRLSAETDGDGEFSFDALPSADVELWAGRSAEALTASVRVRVPDVPKIRITLPETTTVTGTVTDRDTGDPIPDVVVRAFAWSGGRVSAADGTSDDTGRYRINGVAVGRLQSVTAERAGFVLASNPAGGMPPIVAGSETTFDIEMARAAVLTGTVTGPDGPVAGATVRVSYARGSRGFGEETATTDGGGNYRIETLPAGKALVRASARGLQTPDVPANWWMALQGNGDVPDHLLAVLVAGEESTMDLALTPGSVVSGAVRTPDGTPIQGAHVSLQSSTAATSTAVWTAADGTFAIEGVASGNALLQVRHDDHVADPVDPLRIGEEGLSDIAVVMRPMPVVRGRVEAAGGALPAATVVWLSVRSNQRGVAPVPPGALRRTPVAPDGSFELAVPGTSGTLTVLAEAPGTPVARSEGIDLSPETTEYETTIRLAEGHELAGLVVIAKGGEAVPGALVRVEPGRPSRGVRDRMVQIDGQMIRRGADSTVLAIADADGRFAVRGLAKGDAQVSVESPGYVTATRGVKIPSDTEVRIGLEPELAMEGIVAFANGEPVAGVQVTAREGARGQTRASAITGPDGGFRLENLTPGSYVLAVTTNWNSAANVLPLQSAPTAAGTTDVRLVVQPGLTVSGRVVDDAGAPVPQAFLNATVVGNDPRGRNRTRIAAQTDEAGLFELGGIPPGVEKLVITVNARRFGGRSLRAAKVEDVRPGTTGLEIAMSSGLSIDGVLVDDQGEPLENGWISARPVGEPRGRASGNSSVTSGGKFEIGGLEDGEYQLTVRTFRPGASGELVLREGGRIAAGTSGLRLTATTGATISGVVVDDAGGPLRRVSVSARAKGGSARSTRTDAEGRFEVRGLADSGLYDVTASMSGKMPETREGVTAGTGDLRLVLSRGTTSTGTLVDAAGSPLVNTTLFLRPVGEGAGSPQRARTNAEGRFTISGLASGVTYTVSAIVRAGGLNRTRACGTIDAGAAGVTLRAAAE